MRCDCIRSLIEENRLSEEIFFVEDNQKINIFDMESLLQELDTLNPTQKKTIKREITKMNSNKGNIKEYLTGISTTIFSNDHFYK